MMDSHEHGPHESIIAMQHVRQVVFRILLTISPAWQEKFGMRHYEGPI